jgi:hypothetical protein
MGRALGAFKRGNQAPDPPLPDDGIARVLTVTMGVSTTIESEDEGHVKHTGVLLGVDVLEVVRAELRQARDPPHQITVTVGPQAEPGGGRDVGHRDCLDAGRHPDR